MAFRALEGGAIISGTTTPVAVDVQALLGTSTLGVECTISCPDQDVYFCGSDVNETGIVTTATAASKTALIADRAPAGLGKVRTLVHRYLIVRTVAGTGLITIKPV